jgi:hypothetical protein
VGSNPTLSAKGRLTKPADEYKPDLLAMRQALVALDPNEVGLLAQECIQRGMTSDALALCWAKNEGRRNTMLSLLEAVALFRLERKDRALEVLEQVLVDNPEHLLVQYYGAQLLMRSGQPLRARELLGELVGVFPDFPGAHQALAKLYMPGLGYRDVMQRVHRLKRPRTYLEIGVGSGATLAMAAEAEAAVGVDPIDSLQVALPANARFFLEESDRFFARESNEVFGEHGVDLTFIDGLHWFEYALRDFMHAEAWANHDGWILLHDCLPLNADSAARQRRTKFWVGDTWKALRALLDYRPDLEIHAILAAPSGLVLVRRLDPGSQVLQRAMPEIVERYQALEYAQAPGQWLEGLKTVPSDEATVLELLT